MPPGEHARLGASGSKRWMACPGSIALCEGLPNVGSPYAWEGTAAHDLAERAIAMDLPPHTWVGDTFAVHEWDEVLEEDVEHIVEITEEMADSVQVYVDFISDLRERYPHADTAVEVGVDLAALNPPLPMFGTVDFRLWDEATRTLHVVDYKHGRGVVVEVEENSQVQFYTLGAVLETKKKPTEIYTTIVQPRAYHPDGPTRTVESSWEDLVSFKEELLAAAHRTQEPDAPLVAGEHCKFCPALAICPAQKEQAMAVAQMDFADDSDDLPAPHGMGEEELRFVLDKAPLVEEWFKAVREHAQQFVEAGGTLPGYKLVEGRTNRRWVDEKAASKYLTKHLGKKGAYGEPKLLSPAQAEKALKHAGEGLDPSLVDKPEGKKKLAPDTDARPARLPSAVEDFADAE